MLKMLHHLVVIAFVKNKQKVKMNAYILKCLKGGRKFLV